MFQKYKIWIWSLAGIVLFVAIISAGYLYWQKAKSGFDFEKLLPANTFFTASFQPGDEDERKRFIALWDTVLQDKKDVLLPFLADNLAKENGITLKVDDLAKFFGKNFKMSIALTGNRDIYILYSVDDPSAVRDIFKRLKGTEILTDTKKRFFVELGGEKGNHLGIIGNTVFITNARRDLADDIFDRFESIWTDSLYGTGDFRETIAYLKSPFSGYFYVNFNTQKTEDAAVKAIRVSAGSIQAKPDGLLFDNIILSNKKELKKTASATLFEAFKPSLYKYAPAKNLIAYLEGHHLGNIILNGFGGIPLGSEILNKGFAVSISDAYNLLPAISLFVDASEAPDKAKNVLQQLDGALDGVIAAVNTTMHVDLSNPVFEKNKLGNRNLVKIYLNRLPQKDFKIPLLNLLSEPVELSYGMDSNNILFISMLPDFNLENGKNDSVENTDLFKKALKLNSSGDGDSGGEPGNIFIFDGKIFGNFISRLAKEKIGFEILKKYLAPIKSYVQIGSGNGINIKGKGFLNISF